MLSEWLVYSRHSDIARRNIRQSILLVRCIPFCSRSKGSGSSPSTKEKNYSGARKPLSNRERPTWSEYCEEGTQEVSRLTILRWVPEYFKPHKINFELCSNSLKLICFDTRFCSAKLRTTCARHPSMPTRHITSALPPLLHWWPAVIHTIVTIHLLYVAVPNGFLR